MKRRIAQHATALAVAAGLLLASAGVAVSQIVTGSSQDPAASTSTSTDLTTTGLTVGSLTDGSFSLSGGVLNTTSLMVGVDGKGTFTQTVRVSMTVSGTIL